MLKFTIHRLNAWPTMNGLKSMATKWIANLQMKVISQEECLLFIYFSHSMKECHFSVPTRFVGWQKY